MLFFLINCQVCFLKVILTCYDLIFIFNMRPDITHFLVISVYRYSMLAIPEIFCKVYQNLKMKAVKCFSKKMFK